MVLVDFPEFNFRVGLAAARRGIPVIYYIPPQLWAWRTGRARTIARFARGAVVLFPFEEEFLRGIGVNAVFAGHPLLDELEPWLDAPPDPARFGIPPGKRAIGLLPGSRPGEVSTHLPILLAAARLLLQRFPDLHFALPVARPSLREPIAREVAEVGASRSRWWTRSGSCCSGGWKPRSRFREPSRSSSPCWASPSVIVYRTSWLTYQVGRLLAKVDRVGLPNIVSGEKFLPELIQDDCTPDADRRRPRGDPGRSGASGAPAREGTLAAGPASRAGPHGGGRRCWGRRRRDHGREPLQEDARVHAAVRPEAPPGDARHGRACRPSSGSIAFLVKPILDDIFIKKDAARLTFIPLLVLAIYLVRGVFEFAQSYLMTEVGQRVIRDIRDHLYRHMQSLSLSFYLRHPTGMLMSRVLNDVGLMQSAITDAATGLVKDIFTAVFLVFVVFYRDWKLALVAFVVFPLAVWPIVRFGRKLRRTSVKTQEIAGGLSSHLHETISGAKLVKSFGAETYETERFSMRNNELFRLAMKVVKVRAMTAPLSEMFAGVGIAAVMYYGGYSVVNGHSTPGNFFSFMTALFMLYEPAKRLSRINNTIQQGIAAAERVFAVIDTLPEVHEAEGAGTLAPIRKEIAFERVGFRYVPEGDAVLKDIDFDVPAGTMVALVGSSGAGKTTIVDLIPRFYDPQEGAIRIDGIDIRNYTLASLRAQIGIVGQHTILFNDTLRNNIAYGMPGAPMEKVDEAARSRGRARLHREDEGRVRHGHRRAGDEAVGGRAPAGGDRPRPAEGRPDPHPRRGDLRARHRIRAHDPGGAGRPDARAHDVRHRPPPLHGPERGRDPRDRGRADRRAGKARGAHGPRFPVPERLPQAVRGAEVRAGTGRRGGREPLARPFLPGSPGHLLYNVLLVAGIVVSLPAGSRGSSSRRKRRANFLDRLGLRGRPRRPPATDRPTIWMHAVSVGETNASVPLLRRLRERAPDARLLLSNVTLTGRGTAEKALSGVTEGRFYLPVRPSGGLRPVPRPGPARRRRRSWRRRSGPTSWPSARGGIPVVIVNGRLSERSFGGYSRFRWFFAPVLRTLRAISAQTAGGCGPVHRPGGRPGGSSRWGGT